MTDGGSGADAATAPRWLDDDAAARHAVAVAGAWSRSGSAPATRSRCSPATTPAFVAARDAVTALGATSP
ncbi:MAG: hypothetical protein HS111_26795 [Kofleriaceae bacterium]|nr:hypothetical protein [Kofleriaceae bacterium]